MQYHDGLFRAQAVQADLESQRFVHGLGNEVLDRLFAERRQHVFIEPPAEALRSGESHAVQLERLGLFEDSDLPCPQDFLHFFLLAALVVMIPENGDDGNTARPQVQDELLCFLGQSEVRQISAQDEHICRLGDLVE